MCGVSHLSFQPAWLRISYKFWHLGAVGRHLMDGCVGGKWPVANMWIRYPKDHWTLKTGHFEDPNPAKNRFRAPSIGGSKILRVEKV